ncbi:MAG: hypothetical protein D6718_02660 [Acidobacteria bacterium]|nr:MAG: hypothetical protein D6718_02660 [Acidobacteriota bacterium]
MSARTRWFALITGLLAMSAAAYGTLIVVALRDPSFAVEEDYERKAREWDRIAEERARSAALGWHVSLAAGPLVLRGRTDIGVVVTDGDGRPVEGAEVHLETFHNARAAHRLRAQLAPVAPGRYGAALPLDRPGLWEFRLRIRRGPDLYVGSIRRMLRPDREATR